MSRREMTREWVKTDIICHGVIYGVSYGAAAKRM